MTLKKYFKPSLNMFYNNKQFDNDKKMYLNNIFFVSNQIYYLTSKSGLKFQVLK